MRSRLCRLFCVLVLLAAAHSLLPAHEGIGEVVRVAYVLTDADHQRDYIAERTTRVALPAELTNAPLASSSRTNLGRQRSLAYTNHIATLHTEAQPRGQQSLHHWGVVAATSFVYAKDYYIFALRHIII